MTTFSPHFNHHLPCLDKRSSYYNDSSSPSSENKKNLFCCLFAPWLAGGKSQEEATSTQSSEEQLKPSQPTTQLQADVTSIQEQPNQSQEVPNEQSSQVQIGQSLRGQTASPSHAAGTPLLSTNDNNYNNMNAASSNTKTDSSTVSTSKEVASSTNVDSSPTKKSSQQTPEEPEPTGIKGILKVKRCINRYNNSTPKPTKKTLAASPDGKRHLFPTYEPKNGGSSKGDQDKSKERKIAFIPMARVLTIPSRKDIPLSQKAQVWWQRSDYDDFKKTGRIISKAMECGGSEVWLTSTNAWGKGQQSRDAAKQQSKKEEDKNELLVGKETDTDSEYVKALEKYTKRNTKKDNNNDNNSSSNNSDFGNKWWCKFGHSRRGLEHIVSSSEGKARQQSVLLAIEMILEEQKRQRVTRTKDPNKLRNVAMQYTSWARDLALAAGAADNEAVESDFDVSAKSRSHHFAEKSKHLLLKDKNVAGGGVAMAITSQILDENTHGRRNSTMGIGKSSQDNTSLKHEESDTSLRKKAQGFIPGDSSGDQAHNASRIMSGMGDMKPRAAVKA